MIGRNYNANDGLATADVGGFIIYHTLWTLFVTRSAILGADKSSKGGRLFEHKVCRLASHTWQCIYSRPSDKGFTSVIGAVLLI